MRTISKTGSSEKEVLIELKKVYPDCSFRVLARKASRVLANRKVFLVELIPQKQSSLEGFDQSSSCGQRPQ